jgi:ubiquinone/menaquinone biosynthesis C-methylase UbiE
MNVSRYFLRDHGSLLGWIAYQPDDYSSLIITLLHPKQNELILDNGAGNGRFSIAIAKKGAQVISIDINKRILRTAAESLKQKRLSDKAELILGDIQNLPFKNSIFDKVLCVNNLWYIPNYKTAINEMFRTTENGGKVIIDHLNLLNWRVCFGELVNTFMKIFQRNPTPVFNRTPTQITHPFKSFQTETFSLLLKSSKEFSIRNGTKFWASRFIIKSSKPLQQISR